MRTLPSPVPPAIAGRLPRIAGPGQAAHLADHARGRPGRCSRCTSEQHGSRHGALGHRDWSLHSRPSAQTRGQGDANGRGMLRADRRHPVKAPDAPGRLTVRQSSRAVAELALLLSPQHVVMPEGSCTQVWWLSDVSTPMAPRTPGTRTGTGEALPTRPASPGRCSQCCFPSPWESGTNYRPFGSPPTTQSVRAQCASQSHALHTLIRRPEAGSRPGTRSRRPRRPTRGRGGSPMSAARRCPAGPGREPGRTPQPR